MLPFNNYNIGKNVYFPLFLKNITFTFLICTFFIYNDVGTFNKTLERKYEMEKSLNVKFNRVLSRYEHQRGLERKSLREKLPDRIPYKEIRNGSDNISPYSEVKKTGSSNIEQYMKNYKNRYGKKRGLSKLECYCENKIFDKFNHIRDAAKNMHYNKKRSKKFLYKKYGIGLLLFALLPVIGLIYPIIFGVGNNPGIYGLCENKNHKGDDGFHITKESLNDCDKFSLYDHRDIINSIGYVNRAFSCIMVTIVLLGFIYIIAKVIKYERIKSGKGKMKRNEYIKYSKEVFNL